MSAWSDEAIEVANKAWWAGYSESIRSRKGSHPTTAPEATVARNEGWRAALAVLEPHRAAEIAAAEKRGAVGVLDAVQQVYDMQCPVRPEDHYVPGARMAHRWWQKVLGGLLRDLRAEQLEGERNAE